MKSHDFTASDGVRIAWHEIGEGRPFVLLHGLFSSARMNWVKFGHAEAIAARGIRVVLPDFRAHGNSDAPHDAACYPTDILARDVEELVADLGLDEYDLGGFSLGARTTARILVLGARPRRVVLAGMGLEGLSGWAKRKRFFLDAIAAFDTARNGDPHWIAIQFMKTMKIDRDAAALLLESFGDTEAEDLPPITQPVLVVAGNQDTDNGSAVALAEALPNATLVAVKGTHMSSVADPALGEAIADFLAA